MKRIKIPSAAQLQALWLRDVYGLNYREIARELNTTTVAVRGLLFRARQNRDFLGRPKKNAKPPSGVSYSGKHDSHIRAQW
jgi:hypothetical protein